MNKNINLIAACQQADWGIGQDGKIPWHSVSDMRYFKKITSKTKNKSLQNAVIMGRKTFETIGKALPNRVNYVVTKSPATYSPICDINFVSALSTALKLATSNSTVERVFIIGGADIYHQILTDWSCNLENVYITFTNSSYNCDQHLSFYLIKDRLNLVSSETTTEKDGLKLDFRVYRNRNLGEEMYLNLIKHILADGEARDDRTGVGTISTFGEKLTFDISDYLPVLTTKRVAWKTVIRELLWFISGDTNVKNLQAKNVHIWDGNTTREFLDSRGLTDLPAGDAGAAYSFQWRHFGAEYVDCTTDYQGKGYDQIAEVIRLIKEEPTSRRILFSAWNPAALHRIALPPCHLLAQFYVRDEEFLDCQMYQRSADMALGVPFNIASYSILIYMIAHLTGLHPGKFTHIIGDAHIYKNHIHGVQEQLKRVPYVFPRLRFTRKVADIDEFKEEDFQLVGYQYHPSIKLEMAV